MKTLLLRQKTLFLAFGLAALFGAGQAIANGEIGAHVNDLSSNIDHYSEEVSWIIAEIDKVVALYGEDAGSASPERVTDLWEEVDFHSAIEVNYIPIYASIWQGLFGVRMAMANGQDLASVRVEQETLNHTFWQALGAVKMASLMQDRGLLQPVAVTESMTPIETLDEIKTRLDRVTAKHAEQLPEEATEIVQDTYLTLFEGLEGMLIEQDAELVVDLEIDFNVTLLQAIERNASLDDLRTVVRDMHAKLDRARILIEQAETSRTSVF